MLFNSVESRFDENGARLEPQEIARSPQLSASASTTSSQKEDDDADRMDYMLTNVERHQQDRTAQMQDFGSFYKGGR